MSFSLFIHQLISFVDVLKPVELISLRSIRLQAFAPFSRDLVSYWLLMCYYLIYLYYYYKGDTFLLS
jgi:hypothetical protein